MTRTATPLDVIEGRARWCVYEGNSLSLLRELPEASIHAVITDPPYSSGGAFRGDRTRSTDEKYTQAAFRGRRPDFTGDVRDQRSFVYWCSMWLDERLTLCSPDARLVTFTDWRQLPAMTDAIQSGGWIWRGIVPWDKGEGTRPTPGGFRNQCEYAVWASNGPLPRAEEGVLVLPGYITATSLPQDAWSSPSGEFMQELPPFIRVPVKADDKHHQTGKPTMLMRELARVCRPDGIILDPFGGSGTTGVGALLEGRRAIVCEAVSAYAEIARERMDAACGVYKPSTKGVQLDLLGGQPMARQGEP